MLADLFEIPSNSCPTESRKVRRNDDIASQRAEIVVGQQDFHGNNLLTIILFVTTRGNSISTMKNSGSWKVEKRHSSITSESNCHGSRTSRREEFPRLPTTSVGLHAESTKDED
ncbi:hypothetical protein M0802_005371 [Mischocyttarus mexicanus]|nr:hypothetical protein M0802_005371 [Mischocyttarus mexicanus]